MRTRAPSRSGIRGYRGLAAFTLIELMVVVGIIGVVMTVSIPSFYKMWRKEPLNKAVRDLVEVCSNARARAILQGQVAELIIRPQERQFIVSGAGTAPSPSPDSFDSLTESKPAPPPADSGLAAHLSDKITIEMLDVNLTEYKDAEMAHVRFFPNGTCDEMTVVLHSEKGEWIKVALEVTTSLANVGPVNQ